MIVLGRIVAPFGVQGWIKVHAFENDPHELADMAEWWIARRDDAPDSEWTRIRPNACRTHGSGLVASLEGVTDRDAAQALKGTYIGAPRDKLPPAGDDEFYWADLTGCEVFNLAGERLGVVGGLMSTGAHDVLEVKDGEETRLIPFVAAYVPEVDVGARRIRVDWQKDW